MRPVGQHFEIVAGARRLRAAQIVGLETVPVRIVELSDAQALEASIVENLQRRDVHPLDEAQGFAALMRLEGPQYSIEQVSAKCGKTPAYVVARLRLAASQFLRLRDLRIICPWSVPSAEIGHEQCL